MAIDWKIDGREFVNCNCAYGCPCQFNALPTHGFCEAAIGFRFDSGHFGDVRLDGLRAVAIYHWPGAVHQGNGTMQLVIDERANAQQRQALATIMTGGETMDMATMWSIFAAMCPAKLETLYRPITLEIDVKSRRGTMVVPGILEGHGEPIRNPVTGVELRARIGLPNGFEYRLAEVASGRTKASGTIALDFDGTHAHFVDLHLSGRGVVEPTA
jgi:hypothetical protein